LWIYFIVTNTGLILNTGISLVVCLRFRLARDCRLENVVERCSYNMTGADFYALCSDAMLNAITRAIARTDSGSPVSSAALIV